MWYGTFATSAHGALPDRVARDVEEVALDEPEAWLVPEAAAQMRGQPAVELDGGHLAPPLEQRAGEDPEARTDLDDRLARPDLGRLHDRLEDRAVGEVVLREAPVGREAVLAAGSARRCPARGARRRAELPAPRGALTSRA